MGESGRFDYEKSIQEGAGFFGARCGVFSEDPIPGRCKSQAEPKHRQPLMCSIPCTGRNKEMAFPYLYYGGLMLSSTLICEYRNQILVFTHFDIPYSTLTGPPVQEGIIVTYVIYSKTTQPNTLLPNTAC